MILSYALAVQSTATCGQNTVLSFAFFMIVSMSLCFRSYREGPDDVRLPLRIGAGALFMPEQSLRYSSYCAR